MTPRTALISGAGIAGPTLAHWLIRHGWRVTIVERAPGVRSGGNPVDVRGPAMAVAEAMGLVPRLREAATHATAIRVIGPSGRAVTRIGMPTATDIEIPRGDLASILFGTVRDDVELLPDDTIVEMAQDVGGVDVRFARAAERRFDVVVGADGLHSTVRRLVFGPEARFVAHLGLYVATLPLGRPADERDEIQLYNTPGRLVSIHPSRGKAVAAFIFRHPAVPGRPEPRKIIADAYADAGWRVPELLELLRDADEPYFDSVSRVRLPRWSDGRVGLLGDAASCVSLLGDGSTLAMTGAHTLAEALAARPDEPVAAFRSYQDTHHRLVAPKQRGIRRGAALLVPATRAGLTVRNAGVRLLGRF